MIDVATAFRCRLVEPPRSYGIEIEAEQYLYGQHIREGVRPATADPMWDFCTRRQWTLVHDGSLRNNGVEFISPPLEYSVLQTHLREFYSLAFAYNANSTRQNLTPSIRTGIHIHANCTTKTLDELSDLHTRYVLCEPLLFALVNPDREENPYCIPAMQSPQQLVPFRRYNYLPRDGTANANTLAQYTRRALSICCKYAAYNPGPLLRLGTVEFRHAQFFTSRDDALQWLAVIDALVWARVGSGKDIALARGLRDLYGAIFPFLPGELLTSAAKTGTERGVIEAAVSLYPCTYKVQREWGMPLDLELPPIEPGRQNQEPDSEDEFHIDDEVHVPRMAARGGPQVTINTHAQDILRRWGHMGTHFTQQEYNRFLDEQRPVEAEQPVPPTPDLRRREPPPDTIPPRPSRRRP